MKLIAIILILVCIAIAWLLGYRARPKETPPRKMNIPRDYLIGLNFLLNEETDKAVDIFIKMLEVDSDTVETHLAVGNLFRRRGEVDRAIRIHQNLIARPQLEKVIREQSLYELGQDYLSAGMLDRAERIFLELVNVKSHSAQALQALIDIYQQTKDWKSAINGVKYDTLTHQDIQPIIAQYYCELADVEHAKKRFDQAMEYLEKAISADKSCARASLTQAKILMEQGDYKNAIRCLKKIKIQNPHFLSEAIELLASCYEKLDEEDKLVMYLKQLLEEHPRVPVALILAERIRKRKGDKVAAAFVADYVRRYPSLRGLAIFINIYISNAEGSREKIANSSEFDEKSAGQRSLNTMPFLWFSGKSCTGTAGCSNGVP